MVKQIMTPPSLARAAALNPDPDPRGVTNTRLALAIFMISATSCVVFGKITASGAYSAMKGIVGVSQKIFFCGFDPLRAEDRCEFFRISGFTMRRSSPYLNFFGKSGWEMEPVGGNGGKKIDRGSNGKETTFRDSDSEKEPLPG